MTGSTPLRQPPDVVAETRVRLHELAMRRDGEEWLVGRMMTGRFVAMPPVGARAVELLSRGMQATQVAAQLRSENGEEFDVPDFVRALSELGFVAEVDGRPVPGLEPPAPALSRVRPAHVRWLLSPVLPFLVGLLVAAALVVAVLDPESVPGYRSLLWSPYGSLVIAVGAAAGWSLLLLHELAHLLTARATGVAGRITLGTRLQFLVMQTDISGIEMAPRRHRLTAYLSGMAVNLTVASVAFLLAAAVDSPLTSRILSALVLLALLPLPFQFLVFMRTDLYFVLADLAGCRDLYGDGRAYAKYVLGRVLLVLRLRPAWRKTGQGPRLDDPSRGLPRRERRATRVYSVLLVVGTALCLASFALVTLPADLTLLARAATGLAGDRSVAEKLDAVVVLVILGGVHMLWAVTWWRGRRSRRGPTANGRRST